MNARPKYQLPEVPFAEKSKMSAFLYTFSHGLFCLNVDDVEVGNGKELKKIAADYCGGIPTEELSIVHNGCLVEDSSELHLQAGDVYYTALRLPGGKGGFGSMLRAIGAQIEKTTNREACRDLSGRRMRDINDEKKIADWVSKQADRERDKARQKQERLAKRRARPRHTFDDQSYTQHIQENSERVEDALQQGLKAVSTSSLPGPSSSSDKVTGKRVHPEPTSSAGGKKSRLWLGMDDLDSEEDEEFDISWSIRKAQTSTCSSTVTCTTTKAKACTSKERGCPDNDSDTDKESAVAHNLESNTDSSEHDTAIQRNTQDEATPTETPSKNPSHMAGSPEHQAIVEPLEEKVELCLDDFNSADDLESLGLERLKKELMARGLKCGGTIQQRAQRLFATKGVPLDQVDPSLFAKPAGGKKSSGKHKK